MDLELELIDLQDLLVDLRSMGAPPDVITRLEVRIARLDARLTDAEEAAMALVGATDREIVG